MGSSAAPREGFSEIRAELRKLWSIVRTLAQPSGEQLARALEKVQQLIADLPGLITAFLSGGFTTGSMHATGNVTADGGITSQGVALTDITTIPGTRTTVWVHDSAYVLGQTSSTIRKKTNLEPVDYTAEQFLSVQPYLFQYKAQLAIRDDPENPYYDPDYTPTMEVGLIAEHLVEAGLGAFVFYDAEGLPANIDYAAFGAVASIVIGRDLASRIAALEAAQ